MNQPMKPLRPTVAGITSTLILGVSMSACSMDNTTSWKEEVLLHDGKKIIVERSSSVDPNGSREIGQPAPKSEETLKFVPPGGSQSVTWKSDFGPAGQDNLMLLALDIVDGSSYIVTSPNCNGYNKWARPNPPYVFFKYDGKAWLRISMGELPKQIKKANVVLDGFAGKEGRLQGLGIDAKQTQPHLTVEAVNRLNSDAGGDPEEVRLRVFVREPIIGGETTGCR